MRIIIAPDSFKGTLTSVEVARIIKNAVKNAIPDAEITVIPIADGGEGTLECFFAISGGEMVEEYVTGPRFEPVKAKYLFCGETAVVEMAQAAGLPLAKPPCAKKTTTLGVGELIKLARSRGAKKIILAIGGSATNDGGCGIAAALGTKFFDKDGEEFVPVGETLCKIEKIEFADKFELTVLCDVRNPLFGENGAAYVYAPQKGVAPGDVELLDSGLRHLDSVLKEYGIDIADMPGAGAAGGLGAGAVAFCGGVLKRGIDEMLDIAGFDALAAQSDLIITGEGSLDSQSFCGKVIDGIVSRSGRTKVIAIVGISKLADFEKHGLSAVFESNTEHKPFELIKETADEDLKKCAEKAAAYIAKTPSGD